MATGDDGLVKIAEYTGTTDQFAFSSLGGSPYYRGYKIVASLQNSSGGDEYVRMEVNSYAGGYHISEYARLFSSSISHAKQPSSGTTTRGYLYDLAPSNSTYADFYTPLIIDIWGDPSNSAGTGYFSSRFHGYWADGSGSADAHINYGFVAYHDVAAITSIRFGNGGYTNWSTHSRWDLYGYIGADDGELFNAWG